MNKKSYEPRVGSCSRVRLTGQPRLTLYSLQPLGERKRAACPVHLNHLEIWLGIEDVRAVLILLTDLDQMGQSVLAEFQEEVAQISPVAAADFARHVERLKAKLEQLYAVAATLAQREPKIEDVAAIWARMVAICDRSAQAITELRQQHQVADSASHDRILDIRNECEENRVMHA